MKRTIVSLVMMLLLLFVSVEAENKAEGPSVFRQEGVVTLIDGASTDKPVKSFEDAVEVVKGSLNDLGGNEKTEFVPWRNLTDAYGNHYYVFQQMYNNTTVLGGAVKVITDADGHMIGLTSSVKTELPETDIAKGITAEEAEQLVIEHQRAEGTKEVTLQEGLTEKMILPIALELDVEAEDEEIAGSRYVWAVYTDNPNSSITKGSDLPYLTHYVTLDGKYLYSLPTIMAGDEAGASGFDSSYVFEFMEPVDYTGYVDLSTGGEKELTVTVMRDKRTGMYYLGNIERRIVVADCWEFLYNNGRVVLESSPNNLEWDQVGLQTLYNYCRAYDYYKEIGWQGGDGLNTPILVLNNYCDQNHVPVDNAAYVGGFLGWQIFLASQGNDFSQCLDVLAHEFTHCVTSSVMTYNAYMNDYGAINEAMSDIQGKTCQMMMDGRENTSWILGDKSTMQVRSMESPHDFQQPQFTWDLYYVPNVKIPTLLNDQGGVHGNSSLLNYLAWMLYEKAGMTLEEGRAFWFTVDCAMVPGSDYPQLVHLLPWALKAAGLEKYENDLQQALETTRLGVQEMPETYDANRALLTMTLPDNEVFNDGNWVMMLYTLNTDKLVASFKSIFSRLMMGDFSVLPPSVGDFVGLFTELINSGNKTEAVNTDGENPEEKASTESETEDEINELLKGELGDWLKEHFGGVLYNANTNAGQDGHTMRVVTVPGHSLPILMHGVWNDSISTLEENSILVYFAGNWIDIGSLEQIPEDEMEKALKEQVDKFMANLNFDDLSSIVSALFYRIEGGKINTLPSEGLDSVKPVELTLDPTAENTEIPTPKKSRPKLDAKEEAEADKTPESSEKKEENGETGTTVTAEETAEPEESETEATETVQPEEEPETEPVTEEQELDQAA